MINTRRVSLSLLSLPGMCCALLVLPQSASSAFFPSPQPESSLTRSSEIESDASSVGVANQSSAEAGEYEDLDNADGYPQVDMYFGAELEEYVTYSSDEENGRPDRNDRQTESYLSAYSYFDVSFTPEISLEMGLSYETGGGNLSDVFADDELFVETLVASYSGDSFGLYGGKQDVLYGIWDRGYSGLYDSFTTDDLDLDEVLSISSWYHLGSLYESDHYISAAVFTRDSTGLSTNFLNSEKRLLEEDGGVGNTRKLDNFSVSLYGDGLPFLSNWSYSLGFVRQLGGEGDPKNEQSYFSGLYGEYDLPKGLTAYPYIELLRRTGADGEDRTVNTASVGSSFYKDSWNFGLSYSFRDTAVKDDDAFSTQDYNDNSVQLFGGYTFDSGLYIDVAYQYAQYDKADYHTIGMAVGFPLEYTFTPRATRRAEPLGDAEQTLLRRKLRD